MLPIAVLLLIVTAMVVSTIYVWRISYTSTVLLGLFAIAGSLGGVLRSLGYLLAYGSFNARERLQWRLEAVVGPIVGAVAGLLAYLVVSATLVVDVSGSQDTFVPVNKAGQYLVSLVTGSLALTLFGRVAERGLLRGSMSKSGIMGAEVSPSVPILGRIEDMLEQRFADVAVVNYHGLIRTGSRLMQPGSWLVEVKFVGGDENMLEVPGESQTEISIDGGTDRENVSFALSILHDDFAAQPNILNVVVPRLGESIPYKFYLRELSRPEGQTPGAPIVVLDISQGTQTVQVVPIRL